MEQFTIEKHWKDFLKGKFYVNCKTEKLANEFLSYCHSEGLKWSTGVSLLELNYWHDGCECIAYSESSGMVYEEELDNCRIEFTGIKTLHLQQTPKDKVFMFKLLSDVMPNKGISKFPTATTEETIKVIYHRRETIVLLKSNGKHYRGVSKCSSLDTYNKEEGFLLALSRARENQKEGRY